jgi:hypothetical protein
MPSFLQAPASPLYSLVWHTYMVLDMPSLPCLCSLMVRCMAQSRQLRTSHHHAHYVNAIMRYQREMAVQLRSVALFASLDDKCLVPVGRPGVPLASLMRNQRAPAVIGAGPECLDHDTEKAGATKIVPSGKLLAYFLACGLQLLLHYSFKPMLLPCTA